MRALIAVEETDNAAVQELAVALRRNRVAVEIEPLHTLPARLAGETPPELVLVADLAGSADLAKDVLTHAVAAPASTFMVYISDTMDSHLYRDLVRTGRGDWVRWNNLGAELSEVLDRLAPSAAKRGPQAKIICFQPTRGGTGNTTLAMETAISLASRKGTVRKRVCVLDLNLHSSSLPDYYEVEPRFDVEALSLDPSRLDDHLVDLLISKHTSGVDVICSPAASRNPSDVNSALLFALIDTISRRYDIVHLDLQKTWFEWSDSILSGSDAVILTGLYDVPSVRRLGAELTRLKGLDVKPEARAFVVNRFYGRLFGSSIRRSDVEQALAGERLFFVTNDPENASEAINAGQSILQSGKGRALIGDITRIADWILSLSPEGQGAAPAPTGAFGRGPSPVAGKARTGGRSLLGGQAKAPAEEQVRVHAAAAHAGGEAAPAMAAKQPVASKSSSAFKSFWRK